MPVRQNAFTVLFDAKQLTNVLFLISVLYFDLFFAAHDAGETVGAMGADKPSWSVEAVEVVEAGHASAATTTIDMFEAIDAIGACDEDEHRYVRCDQKERS